MRLLYQPGKGHQEAGFSLLEVMVAISVLSVVLLIGIPGFQALFESARERSAISSFVTAVNLARSEALTRNNFTRLCIASGCSQGSTEIRVEVETGGGAQELLRTWETERNVAYQAGGVSGLSVRFSPLGLAVDDSGEQLKAGLVIQIEDISQSSASEMASFCIGVTGSVSKGGCS